MSTPPPSPPSFTPFRRWQIGFDLSLRTVLVVAVLVMVNYLGARFFNRYYLSSQTRIQLSSRTVNVLQGLTNLVNVTLYYDQDNEYYGTVLGLLSQYQAVNPRLVVRTVDYVRNAGDAEKIKEKYKLTSDKDLVIFDLDGRYEVVSGDSLAQTQLERVPNEKDLEFRHKLLGFSGELMFTSRLLALQNPEPLKAYFLQGHGEPSLRDTEQRRGYISFGLVLAQNYLSVTNLELLGNQVVPKDCHLLIIAAPTQPLEPAELAKIDQYLAQGGRLLALLDYQSINHPTGLEPILQRWGVNVMADYVKDPDKSPNSGATADFKVDTFSDHPIARPLQQLALHMVLPRPVGKVDWHKNPPANAPEVQELAFSSPNSTLGMDAAEPPRSYPLMVAAEQKIVAGVVNPRGNTRMVVAGDSYFLGNYYLDDVGNRDFLDAAVSWLLDRTALVEGIGPQKVTEYRLLMSQAQQRAARWMLLGVLPGGVLLLGGLVWFVRRK